MTLKRHALRLIFLNIVDIDVIDSIVEISNI